VVVENYCARGRRISFDIRSARFDAATAKGLSSESSSIIKIRNEVLTNPALSDFERNRLSNSILGNAAAFHTENPDTQLVTLWLSLESLLPQPEEGEVRINSFARSVVACQKRLYLYHIWQWLFVDFLRMYNEKFIKILDNIVGHRGRLGQFVAALCLPEWKKVSDELWKLAQLSPLARERGLILHLAAKRCSEMHKLVERHGAIAGWQLHRIYRERNRILHRANPSENVATLIANLNELYLNTIEAVLGFLFNNENVAVDDAFFRIQLEEEYRVRVLEQLGDMQVTKDNAAKVMGFSI
jgi:hypothetical protein